MTYTTPLARSKAMFSSRILMAVLTGLVLVILQSSTVYAQWTTNGNNINNTNTGNVGIGTATPTAKLHVYSSGDARSKIEGTAASELDFISNSSLSGSWGIGTGWGGSGSTRNFYIYDNVAGSTKFLINSSGNVGIGTMSPRGLLHVGNGTNGTLSAATNVINLAPSDSTTIANQSFIYWGRSVDNWNPASIGQRYSTGSNYGGVLAFSTHADDGVATNLPIERLTILANGNVGIGTSSPSTKLHVVGDGTITGNLTVTGNIAAKYQDVAEWVHSSQELSAGTVVVLDQTKSNQVIASSTAYDTRVAGVISLQPGITLGESGAGKVLVATTGRVRIKVDASSGPIQVGDLLVTSGVAGVAMKSHPIDVSGMQIHRPGTLIGKALEPLEEGQGEILVLLSLQ